MKLARHDLHTVIPFIAAVLAIIFIGLNYPRYNWDMIGYIASAKAFEESDPQIIKQFTYEQLKGHVAEHKYHALTGQTGQWKEFRSEVFESAEVLQEQLPFYQIRPVYNLLIYLAYKIGVNIAFATHLISLSAVVFSMGVIFLISREHVPKNFVYCIPILGFAFGVVDMARLSTPDSLAMLCIISAAYCLLNKKINLLLIILVIMIGVRTNLILLTTPFFLYLLLCSYSQRMKIFFAAACSVLAYFMINYYWDNQGWQTIFYHTLIQAQTNPVTNPPELTFSDYIRTLKLGLLQAFEHKVFFVYLAMICMVYARFAYQGQRIFSYNRICSPEVMLIYICLVSIVAHFILFPVLWERFFSGQYIISFIAMLMLYSRSHGLKSSQ